MVLHYVLGTIRFIFAVFFYILKLPYCILMSLLKAANLYLAFTAVLMSKIIPVLVSLFYYLIIYAPGYVGYDINQDKQFGPSLKYTWEAIKSGYLIDSFTMKAPLCGMPVGVFCLLIFAGSFIFLNIGFIMIYKNTPKQFMKKVKESEQECTLREIWGSEGIKNAIAYMKAGKINKY